MPVLEGIVIVEQHSLTSLSLYWVDVFLEARWGAEEKRMSGDLRIRTDDGGLCISWGGRPPTV